MSLTVYDFENLDLDWSDCLLQKRGSLLQKVKSDSSDVKQESRLKLSSEGSVRFICDSEIKRLIWREQMHVDKTRHNYKLDTC